MIRLTLQHAFECSADRFWELYFDRDFTIRMLGEGLNYECEPGGIEDCGNTHKRSMVITPRLDLPPAVTKILGPRLAATEYGVFDRTNKTWSWDTKLAVLTETIVMGGSMHVEPVSDDQCQRIVELWAEARLFAVGGLVEKAAEKNMRLGWNGAAVWINEFLRRNPAPD